MSWPAYIAFAILSLAGAFLSVFLWMINPVTDLLLLLAAPPLRLLGYHPPVQGFSGLGSAMWVSFFWPLTLLPLYWLNVRLLQWNKWRYAGMIVAGNFIVTLLVLVMLEGS
jgi:hypothetical protein